MPTSETIKTVTRELSSFQKDKLTTTNMELLNKTKITSRVRINKQKRFRTSLFLHRGKHVQIALKR